jgi:hypothetical protein
MLSRSELISTIKYYPYDNIQQINKILIPYVPSLQCAREIQDDSFLQSILLRFKWKWNNDLKPHRIQWKHSDILTQEYSVMHEYFHGGVCVFSIHIPHEHQSESHSFGYVETCLEASKQQIVRDITNKYFLNEG